MNTGNSIKWVLGLVAALALGLIAVTASADVSAQTEYNTVRFEVAEDGARFIFDDLNLHEDGMPAYGSAFVTQGYIYPEGTLNGSNGTLEDGSPEFPELVLGEWTCYGWMIGDGGHTESGEWVVSTQIYKFDSGDILVTNGFEIADFDVPYARAITSGTGAFVGAVGEQYQTLLGFTDLMGVNLVVELQLENVAVTALAN